MPKRPHQPRAARAPAGTQGPGTDGEPAEAAQAAPRASTMIGGAEVPPLEPAAVVVHEGLAVIEVADTADLDALLLDSRFAELVLARIGERAAVALPQVAPRLLLALAKAGHIATVEGDS
jgi:hypothetical protein